MKPKYIMSKEKGAQKGDKKKADKNLKEKRADKKEHKVPGVIAQIQLILPMALVRQPI